VSTFIEKLRFSKSILSAAKKNIILCKKYFKISISSDEYSPKGLLKLNGAFTFA